MNFSADNLKQALVQYNLSKKEIEAIFKFIDPLHTKGEQKIKADQVVDLLNSMVLKEFSQTCFVSAAPIYHSIFSSLEQSQVRE